ncbi:nitrilase-related carbon-nitrogen hydrolase [Pseudogemmobacter sonorensis]|uniref:nitrilase-related carbon-nitrogen hydrolase n=1 Tax=Pseudogemmobacter sonorensis TaxID=2989681 RepID=UPI003691C529
MSIAPWRATCVQIESKIAANATSREEAWTIIKENLAAAVAGIGAACASELPPKLVVLPEFAFQGPSRANPVSVWIERACSTIPGAITDVLAEQAIKHGIYIAGNQFEVDPLWPNRYFNSSFLLNPKGEVILRYRRINTASWTSPHDILDEYLEAYGEDGLYPVADTELGRLAIFPCGEAAVPELSRVLMLRGAEVLLHPNNEPVTWKSDAPKICRASENMAYMISCNVGGVAGFSDTDVGGRSQILDFRGERLAFRETAEPGNSCTAMIDVEALRAARIDTGMGNGLMRTRLEMYRRYYGDLTVYPANQLAESAVETMADFAPVHAIALNNMRKIGIID